MGLIQIAKNQIGDFLGYGRCPVTDDTYWNTRQTTVLINDGQGLMFNSVALDRYEPEELARRVFTYTEEMAAYSPYPRQYSLEEILSEIRQIKRTIKE